MKMMMWRPDLCGSGLENSIKQGVDDHLDEQGAMTAAARKKKATNIMHNIELFLKRKGIRWRGGMEGQHLFGSGKDQKKMRKYCGKKVGVEYCILMLKPTGMMPNEESA